MQLSLVDRKVEANSIEDTSLKVHRITGANLKIYGQIFEKIMLNTDIIFECSLIVADLPQG